MNDADEWQKSESHRRSGPESDIPRPDHVEHGNEHRHHLTSKEVERIEEDVREEVAAVDPAISDS
jgi:hypothetical protein